MTTHLRRGDLVSMVVIPEIDWSGRMVSTVHNIRRVGLVLSDACLCSPLDLGGEHYHMRWFVAGTVRSDRPVIWRSTIATHIEVLYSA